MSYFLRFIFNEKELSLAIQFVHFSNYFRHINLSFQGRDNNQGYQCLFKEIYKLYHLDAQ